MDTTRINEPNPTQFLVIPAKRPHIPATRQTQAYPRKRVARACNTCRFRKAKCDNERPNCGFCQSLGAVCEYDEGDGTTALDPASQLIVHKLDEVLQKLDANSHSFTKGPDGSTSKSGQRSQPGSEGQYPTPKTSTPGYQEAREIESSNELITPPFRTAPDTILEWPVLKSKHTHERNIISDALFEEHFIDSNPYLKTDGQVNSGRPLSLAIVNEETIPNLVSFYLTYVHVKNPILDANIIKNATSRVSTEGLRWDDSSCLVLIMSALGMISSPLSPRLGSLKTPKLTNGHEAIYHSRPYFEAACKRTSLFESCLLSVQCLFLCGTYEMMCWNPLRAYKWFSSASSTLLVHLKCQEAHLRRNPNYAPSKDQEREEASIYWSCYKAMCEIRSEIPLPPSILAEVDYAHVLPSPPSNFTASIGFSNQGSAVFGAYDGHLPRLPEMNEVPESQEYQEESHETIWFFYMTDIILSRLGTRVLRTLYQTDPSDWNRGNLDQMLLAVNEFECKLNHWYASLPAPLKFSSSSLSSSRNILKQILHARSLEIKSILYRPFLYYSLHQLPHYPTQQQQPSSSSSSASSSHPQHNIPNLIANPQIQEFTQKALQTSIHIINFSQPDDEIKSWSMGRIILTSALCICASGLGGLEIVDLDLNVRGGWRDVVKKAIGVLEVWGGNGTGEGREVGDLMRGVDVLKGLISE